MYTYTVPPSSLLPFISNSSLYSEVEKVLNTIEEIRNKPEKDMYKNVIDPFSGLFEAMGNNLTFEKWIEREKMRQSQKTLQNAVGLFHQGILGSIQGWENLKTGKVGDVMNNERKVVAELKNKFNTTKGDYRTGAYDKLEKLLQKEEFIGFTAYYVAIIPGSKNPYDKPFTPSDSTKEKGSSDKRRPERQDLRIIDGKSFYELSTGYPNAIFMLYEVLPKVIVDILGGDITTYQLDNFTSLFVRAYSFI